MVHVISFAIEFFTCFRSCFLSCFLPYFFHVTGGNEKTAEGGMACFDECKTLSTADYVSLLWTTLAELPGE